LTQAIASHTSLLQASSSSSVRAAKLHLEEAVRGVLDRARRYHPHYNKTPVFSSAFPSTFVPSLSW